MRTRLTATLLTGPAAVLAIGLSTAPASAVIHPPTYTANPGGAITATSGTIKLTDTTTNVVITCTSSNAAGHLPVFPASHVGHHFGTITALTFTSCTSPLGSITVTASAFNYHLNITNNAAGITHGNITGIHFTLSAPGCTATVDGTSATADNGTVQFTYKNAPINKLNILATGSNMHIYNVSGCFGLFNNGDTATPVGTYMLAPPQVIA